MQPAPTRNTGRRRPRILIVNASLAGDFGNTALLLAQARRHLARRATVTTLTLAANPSNVAPRVSSGTARIGPPPALVTPEHNLRHQLAALRSADAFLLGTGTHWDSWSSVLQRFLEDATPHEGTSVFLGKPAACVVTEHSVGGKGVLSRLQGVLVTLGCTLPPMSGLVLSRAATLAARHEPEASRDFWCADDLRVVCHNLVEAAAGTRRWKTWPVDRADYAARWLT